MADAIDPTVNPQAATPGNVEPQRTPGSAPSVVPLPTGADPDAEPGTHPLPEDAIDGYPHVDSLYQEQGGTQPTDGGNDPVPPKDTPAVPAGTKTGDGGTAKAAK